MYPTQKDEMTTVKKRTSTQGQYNKAEKVVCESKDKIISTLKIVEGKTSYITGKQASSNNFVPTDEHPFDHFVLVALFEREQWWYSLYFNINFRVVSRQSIIILY